MARKHAKHRKRSRQAKKFTALGAATVTATALTVGSTPLPDLGPDPDPKKLLEADVALAAAINEWPEPGQLPDLTGGLGTAGYNFGQAAADFLIRAIVQNVNLAALAQAAGADPESVLDTLLGGVLGEIPGNLLNDVIGAIPLDVTGVVAALIDPLGALPLGLEDAVAALLAGSLPDTLGGLLGVLGLDLSDVLNLSDLAGPANIITAGPAFTLLKLLGVDLGWVPGLPNSIAEEVKNSPYLDAELSLTDVLGELEVLDGVLDLLGQFGISIPDLDAVEVRVPVVLGFGLGAFSAGAAYEQIVNDLTNQPGGLTAEENPILGSITVLPMVLLRNPGRANGGMFARFYPLFDLLGIDTVTPETSATSSGGIPLLSTGLSIGGANLIPVKIDGTVMYDPLSDFAAWPNPFSLANNLVAGLLPTYILRGLSTDQIPEQLEGPLQDILDVIAEGDPVAVNLYLTLSTATLPLLEPLYLAADLLNLATFGALGTANPFSLVANAFAPVLTSLVNLGYTDVVFNPETGAYERVLDEAGDPTPFLSFPDVNWNAVPGNLFNQLVAGIQREFFSGNPTPGTPNVFTSLLESLLGGDLLGGLQLGGITDLIDNIVGGLLGNLPNATLTQATGLAEASALPPTNARTMMLSTDTADESAADTEELKDSDEASEELPADELPADEMPAGDEEPVEEEPSGEEPVDEEPTEEEPTDEEPTEEEPTEEEPTEEEPTEEEPTEDESDEDAGDEDEADESDEDEDDGTAGKTTTVTTGPKHAKPDNGQTVTSVTGNSPRHAKPDNNDTTGGDATGDKSDGASGAAA